jgi:hypothetical protein
MEIDVPLSIGPGLHLHEAEEQFFVIDGQFDY